MIVCVGREERESHQKEFRRNLNQTTVRKRLPSELVDFLSLLGV